jgi:hypothetical protein
MVSVTADAQTNKKKKNTLIGAGVGAATGAAVSKNHRVKGAVVGGAVGAGAGYMWGRHRQKKAARSK